MRSTPRGLVWVFGIASVLLNGASLWLLRESAVPILTVSIPSMLALCGVDVWANRQNGS